MRVILIKPELFCFTFFQPSIFYFRLYIEMKAKASEPVLRVLEDSASDEGEQEIRSMAN